MAADPEVIRAIEAAVASEPDNVELRIHLAGLLVQSGRAGCGCGCPPGLATPTANPTAYSVHVKLLLERTLRGRPHIPPLNTALILFERPFIHAKCPDDGLNTLGILVPCFPVIQT